MNDRSTPGDGGSVGRLTIDGRDAVEVDGRITFGRDPRSTQGRTVEIDGDPLISKSHFAVDIGAAAGELIVTDLGSSNGTFVHHAGVETPVPTDRWVPLPGGAEIEFGDQRAQVVLDASPSARPVDDDTTTVERSAASAPIHAAAVPPIAPADPWGAGAASASDPAVAGDSLECANCQRSLPAGSKFCDACGTATAPHAAPAHAPAPAPQPSAAPQWAQQPAAVPGAGPADVARSPAIDPAATVSVPAGHLGHVVAGPGPGIGVPGAPTPPPGPGAYGELDFVDPNAPSPKQGGLAKKLILALVVFVVVGLVAFALTQVIGGDDSTSSGGGEFVQVTESIEEQWSESVGGAPRSVAVDPSSVYTLAFDDDDRGELTSLARSDGAENWATELDSTGFFGSFVAVFDEVLVVEVCEDECELIGVDRSTGDEVWSDRLGDGFNHVRGERLYRQNEGSLELIDASSGDSLERVRAEFFLVEDDHIVVAEGPEDVEVYDLDLVSIYGPVEIDEDADAVAFDGERLVVAVGDELQFVDGDGDVMMETSLDVDEVFDIYAVDADTIVLSTADTTSAIRPSDGDAEELWSQDGTILRVLDVDGDAVVLVLPDENSDDVDVVDVMTGDRRFTIDDYLSSDSAVTLGANAVVVARRDPDDFDASGPADTTAFEWTSGDELWNDDFEGLVHVGDRTVVTVTVDGDVTLHE